MSEERLTPGSPPALACTAELQLQYSSNVTSYVLNSTSHNSATCTTLRWATLNVNGLSTAKLDHLLPYMRHHSLHVLSLVDTRHTEATARALRRYIRNRCGRDTQIAISPLPETLPSRRAGRGTGHMVGGQVAIILPPFATQVAHYQCDSSKLGVLSQLTLLLPQPVSL